MTRAARGRSGRDRHAQMRWAGIERDGPRSGSKPTVDAAEVKRLLPQRHDDARPGARLEKRFFAYLRGRGKDWHPERLHLTGERRPRPAGAGDAVVAPCGGDCVALLGPRAHGPTRCAACGRCAQTGAVSQRTRRATRAARGPALLTTASDAGPGGARPPLAAKIRTRLSERQTAGRQAVAWLTGSLCLARQARGQPALARDARTQGANPCQDPEVWRRTRKKRCNHWWRTLRITRIQFSCHHAMPVAD